MDSAWQLLFTNQRVHASCNDCKEQRLVSGSQCWHHLNWVISSPIGTALAPTMDHTFTHRPSRHGPRAEDSQDDDVQFINEIDADIIFVSSFKRSGDSEYHPYIKRMKTLQTFLEITRQPPRKERKAPNEFRFATCVLCQKNFSKVILFFI